MKNPLDIGSKTIDVADVHCIKPLTPEQVAALGTDKKWTAEVRAIGSSGGYIENLSVAQVAAAFAKIGEKLTVLSTGEAIRGEWVKGVKDFAGQPGQPNKFKSVVKLTNPGTQQTVEEWFAAPRTEIPGGKAPSLAGLAGSPKDGPV